MPPPPPIEPAGFSVGGEGGGSGGATAAADAAEGIQASLRFRVPPGEVPSYATGGVPPQLEAALAAMLGFPSG